MKDMLESFKQKVCWQTTKKSNSVILRRCLQITLCVLFSYKIGHTQAAEESATVSLEVDPSNEHPLDDADKAQYDPRFTEAILDVPRTYKVTKGFVHDPHHYLFDYEKTKDEAIIALNGGKWSVQSMLF